MEQVELEKEKFRKKQERQEISREELQEKIREDIEDGKQKVFSWRNN